MKLFKHNLMRFLAFVILSLLSLNLSAGPKIDHWTTDNGLRVYYVNVAQLPMVDMRLIFHAGGSRDADKPGIASMTSAMLNEGADSLTADQLAGTFESVGAEMSAGSARDMAWVTLRTLVLEKEMEKSVDTWLKVIGKPDFPEKNFKRLQKQYLLGLQSEKQSPSALANKAFYKNLYGDHPYASPTNGTEESISALTTDNLRTFYKQYYVAKNAVLAIVGDVDKASAEALAKRVDAQLMAGEKAPAIPEPKALTEAKTVFIPYPSQQAHIMIGQLGDKRQDKDYFTLYLGNHTLGGGGFTSRLMKEIRDARGLSYSVYSYFSPMEELGPFVVGLQTKLAKKDEAVEVATDLVKQFQENGPTLEELIATKKDVTGSFPLGVASNSDIVQYLGMIGFYDLPLDYLDTFTGKIDKITREEVIDAFKRRIQPDKLLTVIVGGEAESSDKKSDNKEAKSADNSEKGSEVVESTDKVQQENNEGKDSEQKAELETKDISEKASSK